MMLPAVTEPFESTRSGTHDGVPPLPISLEERADGDYLALPSARRPKVLLHRRADASSPHPQAARAAVASRYALGVPFHWGMLPGRPVRVAGAEDLTARTSELLGRPVTLGFRMGTPGAYQKVTGVAFDEARRAVAFIKVAAGTLARDKVRHEAEVLRRLSRLPSVASQVPEVLGLDDQGASTLLLLSVAPGRRGPPRWGRLHEAFVTALHQSAGRMGTLRSSGLWRNVTASFDELVDWLSADWRRRLERAMDSLSPSLDTQVPLGLAHRDLTRWNTNVDEQGDLFVFDWEFAEDDYPTSYDVLHFTASRVALARWKASRAVWTRTAAIVGWQHALGYLLDVSLFYLCARRDAPNVGTEAFLDWLGPEIDALSRG